MGKKKKMLTAFHKRRYSSDYEKVLIIISH